jgi:hypothetical protein
LCPGRELGQGKLVCYYSATASDRDPPMNLDPESLNPFLCTHIIYYQAQLDPLSTNIVPGNPNLDLKKRGKALSRKRLVQF